MVFGPAGAGDQKEMLPCRYEFDTFPLSSTISLGTSLKFRGFSFVSNGLVGLLL